VGTLREPGVEAFMSAAKKPITTWNAQQLGIETGNTDRFNLLKMDEPAHEGKCEILEGASSEEKAEKLVTKLKEVKVI
jgi:electron transfer flavoprotein alpha/beta subunit